MIGRRSALFAIGLLGCVFAWGCGGLPENVYLTRGFASPRTVYGEALVRNTRNAELYEGFDTVAKAWVTWKNDDLRSALLRASVEAYRLAGEDAEALRKEENRAAAHVREFHLALYTPKKQWNDLETPTTLWRLYLRFPDGSRLTPVQIVHLAKSEKNPVEYPYVTPWTREYTVLFPLVEDKETQAHPTLILTGPLGTMKFDF